MLPHKVEDGNSSADVTYYELRGASEKPGTFTIRRIGKQPNKDHWFLRHQGWQGGKHLMHDSSASEKLFPTPEEVVAYCRTATDKDPDWADFRKWVGEDEFTASEKMGDEAAWRSGAEFFPSDFPRPQN